MPTPPPQPGAAAKRPRPRTVFVDFDTLEAKLAAAGNGRRAPTVARRSERRRVLLRADQRVDAVRANVRDAARALVEWVALVSDPQAGADLDGVLDRCLKPGPDCRRLNYEALAAELERTMGLTLSPKRVRTAVRHLRRSVPEERPPMTGQTVRQKLDELGRQIERDHHALLGGGRADAIVVRRVATDILGAVRAAVGRVIDCDYGEGIPRRIDIDELEGRYLDLVRDMQRAGRLERDASPRQTLHRLLVALNDYDGDAASDMRLIVCGARAATTLMGADSLPGLVAQLNLLVAGRDLVDDATYTEQMARLADAATALHDEPAARTYLNWVRRLPDDQRVPSPLRIASYCRNNLATRLLERVFTGDAADPADALARARAAVEAMQQADPGFALLPVTQAIDATARARHVGDEAIAREHFRRLGEDRAIEVVEQAHRHENNRQLADALAAHALAAWPGIARRLIRLR